MNWYIIEVTNLISGVRAATSFGRHPLETRPRFASQVGQIGHLFSECHGGAKHEQYED